MRLQVLLVGVARLKTVLFVCVGNSFRSQMAEAYFNKYAPEGWMAVSAGIRPAENIHPNAVRLMAEEGIYIGDKRPRLLTRSLQEDADLAIIVCSGSECPVVYSRHVEEWSIPDPSSMTIENARSVRDEIKKRVYELVERLRSNPDSA